MVRVVASLLLMVFAAVAIPRTAFAMIYGAESFTLGNGMQVVVIPNHRSPVVSHMVWYRAGSADEPPGKSGIAHFLEHLMFKGTLRFPEGAMMDIVARNGGQQNAFTSLDYTGYFQNIAVDRLPLVMDMEADRMRNLVLSEDDVITERQVIVEERRMRVENVPAALLGERMAAALWGTNHYGTPVIGHMEEMLALTLDDAFDFYRKYYAPHNAVLVVAGDITAKDLKPLAKKYYGAIPASDDWDGEHKLRERSGFLAPTAHSQIVMSHERVAQPQWSRQYIAPSYKLGNLEDVYALDIFSEIMGGGATSKLYRELVVDQKVAVSFSTGYRSDAVSYGTFYVSMIPSVGVTTEEAVSAYELALENLLNDGLASEDVERAKARFSARLAFATDSPLSAARSLGTSLAVGLSIEDVESYPDKLSNVTVEQVRDAARRLFTENSYVSGILLPKASSGAATEETTP
ncbi:MAG: peptidase M16 [Candidatus Marinimicrobia bacterium]|nr:peptidase M16 [Candidatus Neomarinimicrobiota bacterium]